MTEAQERLVELDLKKAEVDKYYEELEQAILAVQKEIGVDKYFQADDKTVFKIVIPAGRFVKFKALDYHRTKRDGEVRGSLSAKEATEAGFKL